MENDPRSTRLDGSKIPIINDLNPKNEPHSTRLGGSKESTDNNSAKHKNEPVPTRQSGLKLNGPDDLPTESEVKKQARNDEILRLYKLKNSARQIAKQTGFARNTISDVLHILCKDPDNDITINRSKIAGKKWSIAINAIANDLLPYYHSRGITFPSLRTIFYDLEEKNLLAVMTVHGIMDY
jgi:uncharacterized protein YerC